MESTAREILENHSEAFGRILADSAYALCNLYSLYVTSLTALFWFCDIGSDYALYVALVTTLTRYRSAVQIRPRLPIRSIT